MNVQFGCILAAVLAAWSGPAAAAAQQRQQPAPRRIILYIGDGVGTAYWSAARFAADALAVERMKVMGLVDTRASDSDITDSAAAATAYAAGILTGSSSWWRAPSPTGGVTATSRSTP